MKEQVTSAWDQSVISVRFAKSVAYTRAHIHTHNVFYICGFYFLSFKLCIVGDLTENQIIARVALKKEVFLRVIKNKKLWSTMNADVMKESDRGWG